LKARTRRADLKFTDFQAVWFLSDQCDQAGIDGNKSWPFIPTYTRKLAKLQRAVLVKDRQSFLRALTVVKIPVFHEIR